MRLKTPRSLDEALSLLTSPGAHCLAGGQSLVAMMNARLIEPKLLVSLRLLPDLRRVEALEGGGLRVGAMVTYREIADLPRENAAANLFAQAVPVVAHPAIRTQGTIGGSLCQADPAADFPVLAVCAEATIRIAGSDGVRVVAAADFFEGVFETAVEQGEIVVAVDLPALPDGVGAHYEKFMLTDGDYAVASVAALIGVKDDVCSFARVAVGGCNTEPVRSTQVEQMLVGTDLSPDLLARTGAELANACDPFDDFRASRDYRLKIIPRLVARAIEAARRKAETQND